MTKFFKFSTEKEDGITLSNDHLIFVHRASQCKLVDLPAMDEEVGKFLIGVSPNGYVFLDKITNKLHVKVENAYGLITWCSGTLVIIGFIASSFVSFFIS